MPDAQPSNQRGPRRGWYVRERGGKLLAHARDQKAGRYRALTFPLDQRTQAETWAAAKHAELKSGVTPAIPQAERPVTLRAIGDDYLSDLKRRDASPEHYAQAARVLRIAVKAGIGALTSGDVVAKTRDLLAGLTTRSGKPASPTTRNGFLKVLRTVGNFAIREDPDRLAHNPFKRLAPAPVVRPMKGVFTLPELRRLVDPAKAPHPFYRPFASMVYTGFRLREMANMDWSWMSWDAKRVRMVIAPRARAQPGAGVAFVPKSRRARVTRMMAEYAEVMKPTAEASGLIFPDLATLDRSELQRRFNAFLAHCGVDVGIRTPHSCRHTWTSLMLASGENETLVRQYAGHSEQAMTAHYAQSQDMYLEEIAGEGWARGELSLRAPPKPKVATDAATTPANAQTPTPMRAALGALQLVAHHLQTAIAALESMS